MTSFEMVLYRCEGLLMPPPVLKTKNIPVTILHISKIFQNYEF